MTENGYSSFLGAITRKQWEKAGLHKRAGVSTPLFSLYSKKSTGIGDLEDLELLADWCLKTGLSIIQLLPMNDAGFDFRPYDAQSTFALEPAYLSLQNLTGVTGRGRSAEIKKIREQFPMNKQVNYGIKQAKLDFLWKCFTAKWEKRGRFEEFCRRQHFWLQDYALFKVLKEIHQNAGWESWDEKYRRKDPAVLSGIEKEHAPRLEFHRWLQWQLFEQFTDVRQKISEKKVFLMGDLPFLVSRDSADVWSHQDYFKLELSSGAPPDAFFARGQRWGMPPYNWNQIEARGFDYLIEKTRYAQNFYDFFRIDHVVGTFRLWTIPLSEPLENAGLNGAFDPAEEARWEEHGKKILSVMINSADMLPCAEDLGVVPEASYKTLEEFAVPGMDVQRWAKDWETTCDFKAPENYRKNSIAVISNHDTTSFNAWWEFEAGTVDEELFRRKAGEQGLDFESLKGRLFDLEHSRHGRLRWKPEVASPEHFLGMLGRDKSAARELVEIYRGSYGEKEKFWAYVGFAGHPEPKSSPALMAAALKKINAAESIFSIQLLQDWLSLGDHLKNEDVWEFRINFPGLISDKNWSLLMPLSLEELQHLKTNQEILAINRQSGRI